MPTIKFENYNETETTPNEENKLQVKSSDSNSYLLTTGDRVDGPSEDYLKRISPQALENSLKVGFANITASIKASSRVSVVNPSAK